MDCRGRLSLCTQSGDRDCCWTSRPHAGSKCARLLNGSTVYAELPRRQRRQKLLGMLLQARGADETAALARELLVSESTLAADLDGNRAVGILGMR